MLQNKQFTNNNPLFLAVLKLAKTLMDFGFYTKSKIR